MFVDEIWLEVEGGQGGHGAVSFRREKFVPRGGPDGGDGGGGGSVFLIADPGKHSFLDLRYRRQQRAAPGGNGGPKNRHGRQGADLHIPVPLGTLVRDGRGALLADLTSAGQKAKVAAGGIGGRGNRRFATARHQTPRHAEKGLPGEKHKVFLELKLLAQVGLVGFPNAGKSTLLSRISAARPKVGNFPFTTLQPQLGLVETEEGSGFVAADLPGLIAGAHRGAGLGHRFLRHVERNLLLLLVIDLSVEAQPEPVAAYRQLLEELELYSEKLIDLPRVVAGNKRDLTGTGENLTRLQRIVEQEEGAPAKVFGISAATGAGLKELIRHLASEVARLSVLPAEPGEEIIRAEPVPEEKVFAVKMEGTVYRVHGRRIEQVAAQTDFDNEESLRRFQRYCRRCGLEGELKRMGIKEGDTVCIGEEEFYYDA